MSVRLSALMFKARSAGRIWMKFGMDFMPLGSTLKSIGFYSKVVISISKIGITKMAVEEICEVGANHDPLAMDSYNDVQKKIFEK
jgi:hypothetical protein